MSLVFVVILKIIIISMVGLKVLILNKRVVIIWLMVVEVRFLIVSFELI